MISVNFLPLQARRDRALDATPGGSQARFGTAVVNERHATKGNRYEEVHPRRPGRRSGRGRSRQCGNGQQETVRGEHRAARELGPPGHDLQAGRGDPGRRPLGVQAARETGTEERLDTLNPYWDAVKDHPLTRPRRGPGGCEGRGQN